MNKSYVYIPLVILIVLIVLLVSFKKDNGQEKLVVGAIIPLSGPVASIGEGVQKALELGNWENISFSYQDDPCDAKRAIAAYQQLKLQGVKVYYVACSGSIIALAPLMKEDGNLIVTGYGGSAEIRKSGTEKIRFNPDAISIAEAMATSLATSTEPLILLHAQQDYAVSAAGILKEKLGARIIDTQVYQDTDIDFRTLASKIKEKQGTIVWIPVSEQSAQKVLAALKQVVGTRKIVGDVNLCDYKTSPREFGFTGYCFKAGFPESIAQDFENRYTAKYAASSTYPFYDGLTFDVAHVLNTIAAQTHDVEEIKSEILDGVSGALTSYTFDAMGEVQAGEYMKRVDF